MGMIIKLDVPFRQNDKAARQSALLRCFAQDRRNGEDVFWLKENAEALNVLESSDAILPIEALDVYAEFYESLERRIGFFPQYYRFLLSICMDLEDLGIEGGKGATLAQWVAEQGLAQSELSDLQRAEARRLCLRRGVDPLAGDEGLEERLRSFAGRRTTFSIPNKKAAYELTHIVFYLSEYGRVDPQLDAEFIDSLRFSGTLAYLDLNVDLLAEICIALRFAGQESPQIWKSWLSEQARNFVLQDVPHAAQNDDYHQFLMVNWFMRVNGLGGFAHQIPDGLVRFIQADPGRGPLRDMSEQMYGMDGARSSDWEKMRSALSEALSDDARAVLNAAEASIDKFDEFFSGFSRTDLQERK
ncbi:hypothetical protein ROA7450_00466 [Roseovarius albus]|uniref:Uncharacterized protein n=2 Tax=Roseovarius albus TaxID=1247867 RepID=A0A1X6YBX2_9RHOB|nr:hypothetical protein ROA7450_00466 [Roseovarius albus]